MMDSPDCDGDTDRLEFMDSASSLSSSGPQLLRMSGSIDDVVWGVVGEVGVDAMESESGSWRLCMPGFLDRGSVGAVRGG